MLNTFTAIGRLGGNPEVYKAGDNVSARFDLAISELEQENHGLRLMSKKTHFIPCVASGRLGEIAAEFLKKGSQVGVRGSIVSDPSGEKEFGKLMCRVAEMEFISSHYDETTDFSMKDNEA